MSEDKVTDLIGKTLASILVDMGANEILFTADTGEKWKLLHISDCCESVTIEDVCGDLKDLVGAPIEMAEEATNRNDPPRDDRNDDSYTWTFYKFATVKGYVTIRWYGCSNGYYSERVDFCKVSDENN